MKGGDYMALMAWCFKTVLVVFGVGGIGYCLGKLDTISDLFN